MTDDRAERLFKRRQRRRQRLEAVEEGDWHCGINGCGYTVGSVRDLIGHQARGHPPHTCQVCGGDVPAGFIAIYHALTVHGRAEYVRAYEATAEDVRYREQVINNVEQVVDVSALLRELLDDNQVV